MNNKPVYGFYSHYQNVRDAAWKTLIDFNITSLPVSLSVICNRLNISIIENSSVHELRPNENGIAVRQNGKWYIIFDDTDVRGKQRFTVAHELGHILLGHALKYGFYTRKSNIVKPTDETDADMFAARLLAPACILWAINAVTADQIASVCDISYTAAVYRAERMNLLNKRQKFLTSPLERQVYQQFKTYIQNYN